MTRKASRIPAALRTPHPRRSNISWVTRLFFEHLGIDLPSEVVRRRNLVTFEFHKQHRRIRRKRGIAPRVVVHPEKVEIRLLPHRITQLRGGRSFASEVPTAKISREPFFMRPSSARRYQLMRGRPQATHAIMEQKLRSRAQLHCLSITSGRHGK